MIYHVQQIKVLTPSVSQIILQACAGEYMPFQSGQYIKVLHRDNSQSCLSIACAPNATHVLELHLSHHRKNLPAQDILQMATENRALRVKGPFGVCTQEKLLPEVPILFLARGTGFASVKAMLEALSAVKDERAIHLYWEVSSEHKIYFPQLIKTWLESFPHFQYTPIFSQADPHIKMHERILMDYPDLSGYQVYASGAFEMVHAAYETLQAQGLEAARFYSDMIE